MKMDMINCVLSLVHVDKHKVEVVCRLIDVVVCKCYPHYIYTDLFLTSVELYMTL